MWWRMPVILTLGRWRLEEHNFDASSGYTGSSSQPQVHETWWGKGRREREGENLSARTYTFPIPAYLTLEVSMWVLHRVQDKYHHPDSLRQPSQPQPATSILGQHLRSISHCGSLSNGQRHGIR